MLEEIKEAVEEAVEAIETVAETVSETTADAPAVESAEIVQEEQVVAESPAPQVELKTEDVSAVFKKAIEVSENKLFAVAKSMLIELGATTEKAQEMIEHFKLERNSAEEIANQKYIESERKYEALVASIEAQKKIEEDEAKHEAVRSALKDKGLIDEKYLGILFKEIDFENLATAGGVEIIANDMFNKYPELFMKTGYSPQESLHISVSEDPFVMGFKGLK